jgi:hypothetical protein
VEIVNSKITEDQIVLKDTQFNEVLVENIEIRTGITTRIYGIIKKNLTVGQNAIVYLHGKVLGEIINNGGTVYLFGPSGKVTTL